MRRSASLFLAALLPMSLLTAGASASPPSPYLEAPEVVSVRADALTSALDQGRISEAEYALHRARSLFRLGAVRAEFGDVLRADPHSATLILRDLALRLRSLSGEERETGEAILARPTQNDGADDGTLEYTTAEAPPIDSANFRLHYVSTGDHASTPANALAVSGILEEVYAKEVTQMGWREPKSDGSLGGEATGLFDVYLGNVGKEGIYGYCTVDRGQTTYDMYGYCVLDNDFSADEFEIINGLEAAKVTAAHEFNHAIHYAYDVFEDSWLMEATATWMEDEVYDTIDDNYQYLPGSPLGRPETPADTFSDFMVAGPDQLYQYGTFIWMRYLSETFDENAVREIWEQADAKTAGANSKYSLEAITAMLAARGSNFADEFADFGARNTDPSRFYEEGANYEIAVPQPVRAASHTITPSVPVVATRSNADHLTSRFISFKPSGTVGASEQLTIAVNMGTAPMQAARVVTLDGTDPMVVDEIDLEAGYGDITLPFGGKDELVLVLTNASTRMTCGSGVYSCDGKPLDDNRNVTYSAVTGEVAEDPGDPAEPPTDTTAPVLTGVKVKPNPVTRGKTAKILFTIDEAAAVKITILRSGNKILSGVVSVDSAGNWYVPWSTKKSMKKGDYTVKLRATDAAGNVRTKKTTAKLI